MIRYKCPRCGTDMQSPESLLGGVETCPGCGARVGVPALDIQAAGAEGGAPPAPQPGQGPMGSSVFQAPPAAPLQPSVPPYARAAQKNAPGAVASLVCGILGLIICGIVLGIIAVCLARSARKHIAQDPSTYTGSGMATAGLVLGIIDILAGAIITMVMFASRLAP